MSFLKGSILSIAVNVIGNNKQVQELIQFPISSNLTASIKQAASYSSKKRIRPSFDSSGILRNLPINLRRICSAV